MPYTVNQLAKLSGVSIRTLRFYDEIGLLTPAYYGANGYRYYEEEQLLMLQQILFYRELDIELKLIAKILSKSDFDKLAALHSHRKVLKKDSERIQRLIQTIDDTIKHLKGEKKMSAQEMYMGFSPEEQKKYEEWLIDRHGEKMKSVIQECKTAAKDWKKEDWLNVKAEAEIYQKELVKLMKLGKTPHSKEVQEIIAKHFQWINQFWTPNKETYSGLADIYNDHPEFRKYFEKFDPELLAFQTKAMKFFAEKNL